MKKLTLIVLVFGASCLYGNHVDGVDEVFLHFKQLEFERARLEIENIKEESIQIELTSLKDILFYTGQKDSTNFNIPYYVDFQDQTILGFIKLLKRGYFELYYHKTKSEAFKYFYKALEVSLGLKNKSLQKAALLALLEYYHYEIAQNSQDHQKYLQAFKELRTDTFDDVWITLYGLIYYSKTFATLDTAYFKLADNLDDFEHTMPPTSKLLPKIYFEKGLRLELENNLGLARTYYDKAFTQSRDYPFLRDIRFFSLIRLSGIERKETKYVEALRTMHRARDHIDIADTLKSNYYLNLYASLYYNDLKKYDTAYALLKKAYIADFSLDYKKNTLEISRLNVVLQTQQKELENLNLRQNKIWLIVASSVLGLLFLLSYLAFNNIRNKKRIIEKEKELQTQSMEKLLKEQELVSIDAMIEGQEKERHRIANELHDNLGSLLATVKYHVQNLRVKKHGHDEGEYALLDKTDDLIEEAYQKVRSIAHVRNAGVHAQQGLLPAVKNFAAKVAVSNKLRIVVMDHGMDERLENSLEITLFRIIQELITNIIKHSGAGEATIHLTHHEASINMLVEDNGKGFEFSELKADQGMGLYSIRKRVEGLRGELTVESIKDKGTSVIIDIPLV